MTELDEPLGDGGVLDVDKIDNPQPKKKALPAYRIIGDTRIAVSRSMGKAMRARLDGALNAYSPVYESWEEVFAYYNNHQTQTIVTPRGVFKRGDATENIIFSNLNVTLPAVYSKDPDLVCNTADEADKPFAKALEAVLNVLFRDRQRLNAKPKIRRAVGMGLLTNFGVLKLDWTLKEDSQEVRSEELAKLTDELSKAKTTTEVEEIYGKLAALEAQLEVDKPSGPSMVGVLPHNLIIDPFAELPDGSDANWMIERTHLPTSYLQARYTQESDDGDVLVYQPTHKASFAQGAGKRDDGLGLVLEALSAEPDVPTSYTDDERAAYLYTYMTECYYVWDRATRRVMLFQRDDWTWPLWVWDDPLKLSRFFPYFVMAFSMSTGGTVSVGETSYYLDQQDELNDANRQFARIRRTVFDNFVWNTNAGNADDVEPLIKALRGETQSVKHAIGFDLPEGIKLADVFSAVLPPSAEYSVLFDKERIINAANRISNTSDALRGVQFKTNTNEAAVNTYQDAVRLSVGAKVDVVEDVTSDVAMALAELCIQHLDIETVQGLIGNTLAEGWREMDVAFFRSQYSLELVAGSMEKPNSVFKKKEAVQVAQAIGQFAQAAPGASLRIMLRVLEQAFTEVVISPDDWQELDKEVQASLQKGVSTPQQGPGAGAPASQQGLGSEVERLLQTVPPEVKQQAAAAAQSGASPEQVLQILQQGNGQNG